MDARSITRQEFALRLKEATPLDAVSANLAAAVAACRDQHVVPSTDPAIRLMLDHIGPGHALTQQQRESLRVACRSQLWAQARLPIIQFLTACHAPNAKRRALFCRVAQHVLNELAEQLGWPTGAYGVRANAGTRETGAEAMLHGETVYVRITQTGPAGCEIRYRRCNGRDDFRPQPMLFASAVDAGDPAVLAQKIARDLQLGQRNALETRGSL